MQTIGLIGGISWESSAAYYEGLNKGVQRRTEGNHSAKIVMVSVDQGELLALQEAGEWDKAGAILSKAAADIERGGADFILIGSSTFHKVFDQIVAAVQIPVLHLADLIAQQLLDAKITNVGYVGTTSTMHDTFFVERISNFGIDVDLPDELHHETIDTIVYDELVNLKTTESSHRRVLGIIDELSDAGAQGIIFGASELSQLIRPDDLEIPIFDAITVHVNAALDRALA